MSIQLRGGSGLIDAKDLLVRAGIKQGYQVAEFGLGFAGLCLALLLGRLSEPLTFRGFACRRNI